jgi:hypothetical protein
VDARHAGARLARVAGADDGGAPVTVANTEIDSWRRCAEERDRLRIIVAELAAALRGILCADNAPLVMSDSHSLALMDKARAVLAKVPS